ncbi:hypothetical protein [Acuticoccus sp.]|uniref:hypothetical protein n=1 Tax=Acuticoccus sp. TaxID=1904378 RepID=UPI003B521AEE
MAAGGRVIYVYSSDPVPYCDRVAAALKDNPLVADHVRAGWTTKGDECSATRVGLRGELWRRS